MQEGKSKCMKCQTIINPTTGECGCETTVAFAGYQKATIMETGELVAVWADNSWCFMSDIQDHAHKSDDYWITWFNKEVHVCDFQELI